MFLEYYSENSGVYTSLFSLWSLELQAFTAGMEDIVSSRLFDLTMCYFKVSSKKHIYFYLQTKLIKFHEKVKCYFPAPNLKKQRSPGSLRLTGAISWKNKKAA